MSSRPLRVSLTGPDLRDLLARVRDSSIVASGLPESVSVDDKDKPPSADWIERWVPACRRDVFASFGGHGRFLDYAKDVIIKAANPALPYDPKSILAWLEGLPFRVASFGSIHEDWYDKPEFPIAGFGDMHEPLGWACAFRGDGHNRLVSRRWLEHGPWRLLRGDNDISLIQFHDLQADAETAFKQAQPGHLRMGISDTGGFLQSGYVYSHKIDGLYDPDERRLRILIHGRGVSQLEMLDACAARHDQILGPERPLLAIAYVFADEGEARAHLHELWLRELECRAVIDGREVRLDADYNPKPVKPDWVRAMDEE